MRVFSLIAQAAMLGLALADQPINCSLQPQGFSYVGSTWVFHVGKHIEAVNLYQTREVCTHQMPNKMQMLAESYQFQFDREEIWLVKVLDDKRVEAVKCPRGGMCNYERQSAFSYKGTWDLLYKQSLLVELENDMRFVANFAYKVKPMEENAAFMQEEVSDKPAYVQGSHVFDTWNIKDLDHFNVHCDQTMVGFVQKVNGGQSTDQHQIQCFYGLLNEAAAQETTKKPSQQQSSKNATKVEKSKEQAKPVEQPKPKAQPPAKIVSLAESHVTMEETSQETAESFDYYSDAGQGFALVQLQPVRAEPKKFQKRPSKMQQLGLPHKPSSATDKLIMRINNDHKSTWKANTCMLSKDHTAYDADLCDAKLKDKPAQSSLLQVPSPPLFGQGELFQAAFNKLQVYQKNFTNAQDIPVEEIPFEFDLRNVDGYDFTGPVRDQSGCGSCYTFSFTQVVESRLKQKFGKEVDMLSPQQLLSCNYMTEGCEGGWAIFDGFLAENMGLTTETCAPYKVATKGVRCSDFSSCPSVARVKKTYKLENPDEMRIQKEILRNGAVVTDWLAPSYLKTYKQGLFQKDKNDDTTDLIQQAGNGKGLPNHASILIGWGEQKDPASGDISKFWILRNSFGPEFGMSGDMHVPRGKNTFQVETDIIGFEPEFVN